MPKREDLSGFRVGDVRRPTIAGGKKAAEATSSPVEQAFPAIESRLESSTVEAVAEELRRTYEQLEQLAQSASPKQKGPAKKAMAAYERTADLFEYLFGVKQTMSTKPPSRE